jgi:DNA-binding MarR family transcriptional regulator
VVTREPDPQDGRAKRIVYTPAGRAAFGESRARSAAIDQAWREQLGDDRWQDLRSALLDLTRNA